MKRLLISILLIGYSIHAQIQINEVCSDNDELLQSANGEYYDWIELYNNSENPIHLSNYYLTDDKNDLEKWNIDYGVMFSDEYLIVYASDDDINIPDELHTNFKLSSEGETIYLTDGTNIIDKVKYGKMDEDYTFGRLEEKSDLLTYLAKPTPRESNRNSGTIISSRESGYYVSEFNLKLIAAEGHKIYYTTNGDDPTIKSLEYKGAIEIKDEYGYYKYLDIPTTPTNTDKCYFEWKKVETEIPRCKVISFRVINEKGEMGKVYNKSYFFQNPHDFPVVSIITDNQNLFNHESGIYVPGVHFDSKNPCSTGNYKMRGDEWEKPMSFSYFENEKLISTNYGGMRIHGSGSRDAAQKSLRFYARKKYGVNKFPNVYLPELDIENFDNFILRATMSDHSMALIKDAISMKCVRGLKFEQTYINPVVVYINGNYWGLHEVRNRFDEEYLGEKYNLVEDSIDIVSPVVFGNPWEAKYKRMKIVYDYIVEHDLSIDENYKYIEELFDIPQMIDYYIAETYFVNTDWPGNNFLVWTSETNQKYKPLFYDLDAGWRDREKDMIEYATQMEHNDYPNPSSTNVIFSKLLSNDEFKQLFIERALYLIENEFSYEKLKPIIDKYINQYRTEISRNIDRWHFPESEQRWQEILFRDYYEFARLRGCYYKQHLVAHFNLDDDMLCSQTNINDNKNLYITLSPNPANDYLTIDNFDSEEVAIIDIHGQEIIKINSNYNKKVSIDISNLAPSVYFIKIKNALLKFVKIK